MKAASVGMLVSRLSSLKRRTMAVLGAPATEAVPQWVRILSGPLKGRSLLVPRGNPAWRPMEHGEFESFVYDALGEHLDFDSATIWDVGAHVGYHALAFAQLVGESGRVVAFEPNRYNADRIRQNLSRNTDLAGRITLITTALSDQDGEASLVFSSEVDTGRSSGSHVEGVLPPAESSVYRSFERTSVATSTIDTLLHEGRLPTPSAIKLDVEGGELLVLKGAYETLSKAKPVLLMEMHHIITALHVQRYLIDLGYELEILIEEDSSSSRCHVIAKPSTLH